MYEETVEFLPMTSYIQNEKDVLIDVDDDLLHSATRDLSVSSCAIAMLFGTIIFTTVTLAARLWLVGLWSWEGGGMPIAPSMAALELSGSSSQSAHMDRNSEKSQPLDTTSLTSIYDLLHHSSIFGIILLYSYICEHHPPYPHDEKVYDRDEFFFWTILVVVVAGWNSVRRNTDVKNRGKRIQHVSTERLENIVDRSVKKSEDKQYAKQPTIPPENEVLNRNQTEEWKGWMQFTFLLYHYMHATEVYNGIRVMITCYVWMTGFGELMGCCCCRSLVTQQPIYLSTTLNSSSLCLHRKLLLLLHDKRLLSSPCSSNAMETKLLGAFPLSNARQSIHPILYLPTAYLLLLNGVCSDVRWQREELYQMVDTNKIGSVGIHHISSLGR